MTKIIAYITLIFGLVFLALGWVQAGYLPFGLALFGLIPISLALVYRKFRPALGIMLVISVLLAAIGLWAKVSFSLSLLVVICALAAWDLDSFSRRLVFAGEEDDPAKLERAHLLQISLVMFVSVGIVLVSLSIRFAYGFEWTLGLALLAFYGIGALFNAMRKMES